MCVCVLLYLDAEHGLAVPLGELELALRGFFGRVQRVQKVLEPELEQNAVPRSALDAPLEEELGLVQVRVRHHVLGLLVLEPGKPDVVLQLSQRRITLKRASLEGATTEFVLQNARGERGMLYLGQMYHTLRTNLFQRRENACGISGGEVSTY